jgi:DNA-binding transcriptional MerR regulator
MSEQSDCTAKPGPRRDAERELSARELAELAGTTVRTIHYYASEGLLPAPSGSTRAATYTAAHLARLRLIGALRDEGLSLAGIRMRLAPLNDAQALAVVDAFDRHLAAGNATPLSSLGLIDAAVNTQIAGAEEANMQPVDALPAPAATARRAQRAELRLPPPVQAQLSAPDSARDYLDRVLRRPPEDVNVPAAPAPAPPARPRPPTRKQESHSRPEAWYHFRVSDGIELRVREDHYYQAKGRMQAVVDGLRATLQRYGMLGHDPPDDTITRRN